MAPCRSLGDPPDYHPEKTDSIADKARRAGASPLEAVYDALLADEGRAVLYRPAANCAGERFEDFGAELIGAFKRLIENPVMMMA